MNDRPSLRGGRRGLIATVAGAVLLVAGSGLIGAAIASQRPSPQLPVTTVSPLPTHDAVPLANHEEGHPVADPTLTLPSSRPVRLDIPAIGVHSVVRAVGRTAEGALETPAPGPYYNDAAWYRHSPTPGELGPAILLGHVDSASEGPSVFFRLGELRKGQRISVTRTDGSIAVFVVDEVRRYPKDAFPTDRVYGDIDHAGLRILTCGGPFDEVAGHYLDNVVVFASLAGPGSP